MIVNFLQRVLFPMGQPFPKKRKMTDLEKYIISHKPDSLEQVEWLQKQYSNGKNTNANLYY